MPSAASPPDAADAIAPLIAANIDADHRRTLAHGLVGLAEGVSRRLVEQGQSFDPLVLGQQVADLAWAGSAPSTTDGQPTRGSSGRLRCLRGRHVGAWS